VLYRACPLAEGSARGSAVVWSMGVGPDEEVIMEEPTNAWPELAEMSRLVLELATAVVSLLDAHETVAGVQAHKLVREARDLHHRIQAREFTS
jgi:hypothetical protein